MQAALRLTARVQAGHKLEINSPELPEGEEVDVFVVLPAKTAPDVRQESLIGFLDSLPPGPRSADTWEELERTLQQDRDSWDR